MHGLLHSLVIRVLLQDRVSTIGDTASASILLLFSIGLKMCALCIYSTSYTKTMADSHKCLYKQCHLVWVSFYSLVYGRSLTKFIVVYILQYTKEL